MAKLRLFGLKYEIADSGLCSVEVLLPVFLLSPESEKKEKFKILHSEKVINFMEVLRIVNSVIGCGHEFTGGICKSQKRKHPCGEKAEYKCNQNRLDNAQLLHRTGIQKLQNLCRLIGQKQRE